jgi:hypothetical protein
MLINSANATITPIKSIREARAIFHKTDASTLVVFDLIDTLLKSHKEDYNPKLKPDINTREFENYKENGMDVTLSAVMAHSKRHLVELELAKIVEIARKNQSKVVALSHYLVGAWGMIKSIQEWRFNQLKLAGLDLSPSFGDSVITLNALSAYRKTHPVYYRGILFTNGHSKGDTLEAFLAQVNWKPKSIIAVDDNLAYLKLIEQMARKNKIPFQGFHYQAATL